jgi:hypothetical protein
MAIVSRPISKWKDGFVVFVVAFAALLYFTVGSILVARLTRERVDLSFISGMARFALAFVVALLLFIGERRRQVPTIDAATREGLAAAVVIVVTESLFSVTPELALGWRTAIILIGLPLLSVLTHVLARRVRLATHSGS